MKIFDINYVSKVIKQFIVLKWTAFKEIVTKLLQMSPLSILRVVKIFMRFIIVILTVILLQRQTMALQRGFAHPDKKIVELFKTDHRTLLQP